MIGKICETKDLMNYMEIGNLRRGIRAIASKPDEAIGEFFKQILSHDLIATLWLIQDPEVEKAAYRNLSGPAAVMMREDLAAMNNGLSPASADVSEIEKAIASAQRILDVIRRLPTAF